MIEGNRSILILDQDTHWVAMAAHCLATDSRFDGIEIPASPTLAKLQELAQRPWGLVLMNIFAAIDQRHPMDGLVAWDAVEKDTPLLVFPNYQSLEKAKVEARDVMGLGATFYYDRRPFSCPDLNDFVNIGLDHYQRRNEEPSARQVRRVRREDYLERFGSVST